MKFVLAALVIWLVWRWLRPAKPPTATERAARLLGVPADADGQTIRDAYRARVAAAHPDRGGSDAAMRELTAARDLLENRR